MAVSDFTVRFNGTVAYDNNSTGSFEASAIWKGNLGGVVATHSSQDSLENFRQLFNDRQTNVNNVLAVLPGSISLTTPAPSTPKTVSSFVLEISGLVAENDNIKHVFIAQWVDGVVDLFPDETDRAWALITADSNGTNFMEMVLEAVAGSEHVTISA